MRHPVRRKNGAVVVALDARGGLASGAPQAPRGLAARRPSVDLPSSVERLASLHVALAIAKADKKAGRTPNETPKAIKDRIVRLRKNMVEVGPEGAELARAVTLALAGQGGRFLRTAERASAELRPYVERAGAYLAAFVLNGMRVPAALVRAGSSALNEAIADMLRDQLVALDPTVGIAATKSRVIDGARVTNTLPTFDALWKQYQAASTQAGKDAALAIHLEGWGREQEREQSRRWEEQRWTMQRAVRSETNDERAVDAELVVDEDQDVGGVSHTSCPAPEEHGAPPGEVTSFSSPGGADDLREAAALALEPGAYCPHRRKTVFASLAGKKLPSAASGADWPQRLKDEERRIAEWERANERAQMGAASKRSGRR